MSSQASLLYILPMMPIFSVIVFGLLAARRLSKDFPIRARLVAAGMTFWLAGLLTGFMRRSLASIGQLDSAQTTGVWPIIAGISSDLFFLVGCGLLLVACLRMRQEYLSGLNSKQRLPLD